MKGKKGNRNVGVGPRSFFVRGLRELWIPDEREQNLRMSLSMDGGEEEKEKAFRISEVGLPLGTRFISSFLIVAETQLYQRTFSTRK